MSSSFFASIKIPLEEIESSSSPLEFFEYIKELLMAGKLNPNEKFSAGTLLTYAAENGNLELVNLLLEKKSDVNAKSEEGGTPLAFAAQKGHADVVKVLIEKKANPNEVLSNGLTPLAVAVNKGHLTAVDIMLKNRADPMINCIETLDTKTSSPVTKNIPVVFYALRSPDKNAELAQLLLIHKATPDAKDSLGLTFETAAKRNSKKDILEAIKLAKIYSALKEIADEAFIDVQKGDSDKPFFTPVSFNGVFGKFANIKSGALHFEDIGKLTLSDFDKILRYLAAYYPQERLQSANKLLQQPVVIFTPDQAAEQLRTVLYTIALKVGEQVKEAHKAAIMEMEKKETGNKEVIVRASALMQEFNSVFDQFSQFHAKTDFSGVDQKRKNLDYSSLNELVKLTQAILGRCENPRSCSFYYTLGEEFRLLEKLQEKLKVYFAIDTKAFPVGPIKIDLPADLQAEQTLEAAPTNPIKRLSS